MRPQTFFVALVVTVLSVLSSRSARALTFDRDGMVHFERNAAATVGFETGPAITGVSYLSSTATSTPIEGTGYARISTARSLVTFPLALPKVRAAYVARLFARSNRLVGGVDIEYPDDGRAPGGSARFFPTGRVTSDGWYELTTNRFSVDGTRSSTVSFSLYASGADIDALEVVPDGAFKELGVCEGVTDSRCGPGEFCSAGFCRDGNLGVPPIPPGEHRDSVVGFLSGRLRAFFGGRYTRAERLPRALATIETMRDATTPWDYWNRFATALHQLHDWHTKINAPFQTEGRGAFPICVVEGDADLSRDVAPSSPRYPDVLVSHVGPEGNSGLKPGDRIVAINGLHPLEFVESLDAVDWSIWKADDPDVHAESAERLRYALRRWGVTLTIIRCDPQTKSCSPPETLPVTSLPKTEPAVYPTCDHRPGYHLVSGNPDAVTHNGGSIAHGLLKDSQAGEALYGMIWDDVYMDSPSNNPYSAAIDEFRANAKGVVLDHRTGNGGTQLAAEYLTSLFRPTAFIGASSPFNGTVGLFDPPFDNAFGLTLLAAFSSSGAYNVGASSFRPELKTALLLARDGSASDWFPMGMKGGGRERPDLR